MEEELELVGARQPVMANLFARNRQSPKGGRSQYPWTTTKLIVECLVTGASPKMVQSLMFTFAKTFDPDYPIESRPDIDYINKCRSTMKIIGEVCTLFELSFTNLWAEMLTDGTSLRTIPVQEIIISISEKRCLSSYHSRCRHRPSGWGNVCSSL